MPDPATDAIWSADARHWRTCAESADMAADAAEQRGAVYPRLIALMREDADRYRMRAAEAEAREEARRLAARIGRTERWLDTGWPPC